MKIPEKIKQIFSRNEVAVLDDSKSVLQRVVNISSNLSRHDSMEGRDYIVVPMVMLVEGVLSNGVEEPLFYPAEEIEKFPGVWNHKPVVVDHPQRNGEGVSACDPIILSIYKIGVIMNAHTEKTTINGNEVTRLVAEAWLEEDRVKAVDLDVWNAVESGKILELSTGVVVELEQTEGEFNGQKFSAIARNYRPDHLAILPNKEGACSIKDGAGFIRNELDKLNLQVSEDILLGATVKALDLIAPFAQNEMSHDITREGLHMALKEKFSATSNSDGFVDVWIEEVFNESVIYQFTEKFWKLNYSKNETEITLGDGGSVEVTRITKWQTIDGTFVGNETTEIKNQKIKEKIMAKKEIVDALIKNEILGWSENHREFLEGLDEDHLNKLVSVNNDKRNLDKKDEKKKEIAFVVNQEKKDEPQTLKGYIENAPEEMRGVLLEGVDAYSKQKSALIEGITANSKNQFSKEELEVKELSELRQIASLAINESSKKPSIWTGLEDVSSQTSNQVMPEPLELPVTDWEKAAV